MKTFIISLIIILAIAGGGFVLYKATKVDPTTPKAVFAQCLKDKGAIFYGAFWCPHCQLQKAMFGAAKKFLPYVECSNPDNTQTKECTDKKITSYPTWELADGTRLPVENENGVSFATLAEKTGCAVPTE